MTDIESLRWTSYTRLPGPLEAEYPHLAAAQSRDKHGAADRLEAIKAIIGDRQLDHVIDLGGNSGYFCLSLIHAGIIKKATVYDLATEALAAGRIMAEHLGISDRIEFIEQMIDLEFLRGIPHVDMIMCLNLLHHAGQQFDETRVEQNGWASYSEEWLSEMRRKSRLLIFGIAFDQRKPLNWDASRAHRPAIFAQLASRVGWSLIYDANVNDIQTLGVERADGRYTKGDAKLVTHRLRVPINRFFKKLVRLTGLDPERRLLPGLLYGKIPKTAGYHLYIFETAVSA